MAPSDAASEAVPNLVVAGAPKAGSTTVTNLLGAHPDVFFAARKDTQFFARDLVAESIRPGETEYREMFAARKRERRVGEASVFYLYSDAAREAVATRSEDPRIVILVRNPVELVHSYHGQLVFSGLQPIDDFREAFEAGGGEGEVTGSAGPSSVYDQRLLDYEFVGTLSPHIERWIEEIGQEGVVVVLFDDLIRDTEEVLRGVFQDIGVDPSVQLDVEALLESDDAKNPHAVRRSALVRELIKRPGPWLRSLVRLLVPSTRLRGWLAGLLDRRNRRYVEREPLSPEMRTELERRFGPEIRRLEELLGRDLGHWLGTETAP